MVNLRSEEGQQQIASPNDNKIKEKKEELKKRISF